MEENKRKYSNKDITVHWDPVECIHATTCYKNLYDVFNPTARPWINMEGAPTNDIINIIKKCPTNALTFTWNNNKKSDKPPENAEDTYNNSENKETKKEMLTKIELTKNGPLIVEGDFKIINHSGIEMKKKKIAFFCRCGKSKNMPFCDGEHRNTEDNG